MLAKCWKYWAFQKADVKTEKAGRIVYTVIRLKDRYSDAAGSGGL